MVGKEGIDKMTFAEPPYFLTNEEWYYFDEKEFKYKLTDKAPQEAIDSYNECYEMLDSRYLPE